MNELHQEAAALLLQHERETIETLEGRVPRSGDGMHVRGSFPVYVITADSPPPEPPAPAVCIPVLVLVVVADPVLDPYPVGTVITFTAFGVTGTEPFEYEWYLNGALVSTDAIFIHTLVTGDVNDPDAGGIGPVFIYVKVTNACGEAETDHFGSINGQI